MTPITAERGIAELSREDGRRLVDDRARHLLGIGLEQFEADYDAGKLDPDSPDVRHLVMLLPFAR